MKPFLRNAELVSITESSYIYSQQHMLEAMLRNFIKLSLGIELSRMFSFIYIIVMTLCIDYIVLSLDKYVKVDHLTLNDICVIVLI
ncbi:hypothetical protein HanPI659440_Chr06g0235801 [Helianthus annuus]|nr:hypothetical protein HanPI659440_Chr06g0235801 [Helianthus annuus]